MRRASIMLRPTRHYRREAFAKGLERHGYHVSNKCQRHPREGDLLLLWNRTRGHDPIARRFEEAGATVLIAENGYLDRGDDGRKYYALALDKHNGCGRWFVGDKPRFRIAEKPWRKSGSRVLILPQRGIGQRGVAMPTGWPEFIRRKMAEITDRPLIFRRHPGLARHQSPLDFSDLHCAITWGSGAGIKAIRAGIPVFHDLQDWIGAPAAARLVDQIEECHTPNRDLLWTRLSWAQWTIEEIASGEALEGLLNADRSLFCARQASIPEGRPSHGAGHQPSGRECHA